MSGDVGEMGAALDRLFYTLLHAAEQGGCMPPSKGAACLRGCARLHVRRTGGRAYGVPRRGGDPSTVNLLVFYQRHESGRGGDPSTYGRALAGRAGRLGCCCVVRGGLSPGLRGGLLPAGSYVSSRCAVLE